MSYTSNYRVRVGSAVKADDVNALKANWDFLNSKFKFRTAFVVLTSDLSIANGVPTAVSWQSAIIDTDSLWNVSSPTLLTPSVSGGRVRVWANLSFSVNGLWDAEILGASPNPPPIDMGVPRVAERLSAMHLESALAPLNGAGSFRLVVTNLTGSTATIYKKRSYLAIEVFA